MNTTLEEANNAYERGDFAAARRLYELLAKEGHANTLVPLARMYIDGEGGCVDFDRAEALLEQAIALGVQEGVLQRAALSRARGDAVGYFQSIRDAANLGILPAQYQYGLCYQNGDGVARDPDRALEIMRAAATRGHLGAQIFQARHLLSNPLHPIGFVSGLFLLISASAKSIYLAFSDPHNDLLR